MQLGILNISYESEAHINNMIYSYGHNFSIGQAFLIPKSTILSVPKSERTLKSEPRWSGAFFFDKECCT